MKKAKDPIGKQNNSTIMEIASSSKMIICAWGDHGLFKTRSIKVIQMLKKQNIQLFYLELNKSGEPKHPLYIKGEKTPKPLIKHPGISP